jgi:hypothetical protein
MVTLEILKERFGSLDDAKLLEILKNKTEDYTQEALEVANQELQKRGGEDFVKERIESADEKEIEKEIEYTKFSPPSTRKEWSQFLKKLKEESATDYPDIDKEKFLKFKQSMLSSCSGVKYFATMIPGWIIAFITILVADAMKSGVINILGLIFIFISIYIAGKIAKRKTEEAINLGKEVGPQEKSLIF